MILKKHDRTDQKDNTCVSMHVLGGKKNHTIAFIAVTKVEGGRNETWYVKL